jgi:soluble lytic murein transglycosylase-like protein
MKLLIICLILMPSLLDAFCFEDAGKQYGIHYRLLESIAGVESNMNPRAFNINRNGSFDIGLMQINSFWIKMLELDKDELVSNPCYNVMVGANILKQCIDRYGFSWEAVGCYNATDSKKKINYSWKVFQNLRSKEKNQMIQRGSCIAPAPTLLFSVKDKYEE